LARLSALIPFAVAASLAACASAATSRAANPRSSDEITSAEIAASSVTNVYALIERLRPTWLRAPGIGSIGGGAQSRVILVYLDGQQYDLQSLRSLSVNGIRSLQWVDATRAATVVNPPPSGPIAGAIMIKTQ
jgi:hypothetical protein